jgi:hypothetical protein
MLHQLLEGFAFALALRLLSHRGVFHCSLKIRWRSRKD